MATEVQTIVRLPETLSRAVDRAKRKTGMSKKAILTQALRQWLERQKFAAAHAE